MAKKKKWMQEAFKNARGQLRKKLGIKKGESMTVAEAEAAGKKKGKIGKQGRLAATAIKISKRRKRGK